MVESEKMQNKINKQSKCLDSGLGQLPNKQVKGEMVLYSILAGLASFGREQKHKSI